MRKILVVVDMQNDFIDGALGTSEAAAIVENVKLKIREYRPEDIFATMDTHGPDYLKTQEGRNLPVEHCIKGTEGWKIRADIAELLDGVRIFEKPAFGSIDLARELSGIASNEDIEIEIIGLCTDICVVSNGIMIQIKNIHRYSFPRTANTVLNLRCPTALNRKRDRYKGHMLI